MSAILSLPAELHVLIARGLDNPQDVASLRRTSRIFSASPDIKTWMYTAAVNYSGVNDNQLSKYVVATVLTERVQAFKILSRYLLNPNSPIYDEIFDFIISHVHEDLKHEFRRRAYSMSFFKMLCIMAGFSPIVVTMLDWYMATYKEFIKNSHMKELTVDYAAATGNIQLHEVLMKYQELDNDLLTTSLVEATSKNKPDFVEYLLTRYPARSKEILQSASRTRRDFRTIWRVAIRSDDMRSLKALLDCYRPGDYDLSDVFDRVTLSNYKKPLTYLFENGLRPNWQLIRDILEDADLLAELLPVLVKLDTRTTKRFVYAAWKCPNGSRYVLTMGHPYLDNMHFAWSRSILNVIYQVYDAYQFPEEEVLKRISKAPELLQLGSRIISVENLEAAAAAGHLKVVQMAFPMLFDRKNRGYMSQEKTAILVCAICSTLKNRNATLCVQYLLEAGIDVNLRVKIYVDLEAESDVDLEAESDVTMTPLEAAVEIGSPDILISLFDHGARMRLDPTDADEPLPTAADLLERAIDGGSIECARILLDNGARSDQSQSKSILDKLLSRSTYNDMLEELPVDRELCMKMIEFTILFLKAHPQMVHGQLGMGSQRHRLVSLVGRTAYDMFGDNKVILSLLGVWICGAPVHMSDLHGYCLQSHPVLRLLWDILFMYGTDSPAPLGRRLEPLDNIWIKSHIDYGLWELLRSSLEQAEEPERRAIALEWLTDKLPKPITSADLAEDDSVPEIQ